MQACELGGDDRVGGAASAYPPRFLECPDGVVRMLVGHRASAEARGGWGLWSFLLGGEPFRLWRLDDLCWSRVAMLSILQGASLQGYVGPRYIVVDASIRPPYSPTPGLDRLWLAEPLTPVAQNKMGEITVRLYEEVRPVLSTL